MKIAQKRLFEEALKLPAKAKVKLADQLISSMAEDDVQSVEKAWMAEIKRRLQELKAGKTRLHDGDKVLAALKKKYSS